MRWVVPTAAIVAAAFVAAATVRDARQTAAPAAAVADPVVPGDVTSRSGLARTVAVMTDRLSAQPDDGAAVVALAGALLRLQRVNNDARAVDDAAERLRAFLQRQPDHYDAQRQLAVVLLAQHKFGEAVAQANRARARDPRDAWNYGAIGDGYLELGDYDRAFEAFDTMGRLQPGPPAYARVAYALELKGDLPGALEYMQRAADGTTPNDSEAQAWHYAQVGELLLKLGRAGEARREFERAAATFPGHPFAHEGLARIKVIDGDLAGARLSLQQRLSEGPTADVAALVGDLSTVLGEPQSALQYYAMAEQIERSGLANGARQPNELARFLAERDRSVSEAVSLAERAAISRRDVHTSDTLAWAYFKAGRLADARLASAEALRLGTRDPRLLYHAAAIAAAAGDHAGSAALLDRIAAPATVADVLVSQGIRSLRATSSPSAH